MFVKNKKISCLIMALSSNTGMGRNMEIYYKCLNASRSIKPIMVYSRKSEYDNAPKWISNKNLIEIKEVDHLVKDCKFVSCKKAKELHRTYDDWVRDSIKYIIKLRHIYGERAVWVLDMTAPELEKYMGSQIVQVFHGELFDVGVSYFNNKYSFSKYKLIFVHGNLIRDRISKRLRLRIDDPRFKFIGRVLNDSLYNSTIIKSQVLSLFGLNPRYKTVTYAPSWESRKIWPIGSIKNDLINLNRFLQFTKANHLNTILRPHPISLIHHNVKNKYINAIQKYNNVYFDDSTKQTILGPNQSLTVSDILITDLSSIAIDFMSLDKPSVFMYPDSKIDVWGNRLPSVNDVSKVSYTVMNFDELYKTLLALLNDKETINDIKNRKDNVLYALSLTDGTSGMNFRKEIEKRFTKINLFDYLSIEYVSEYLQFVIKYLKFKIKDISVINSKKIVA